MNESAIRDVEDLEDRLSAPTERLVETMARLEGDIIILGVAGKLGPTLARMARRSSDMAGVLRRVIGVASLRRSARRTVRAVRAVERERCI